ncbi:MAG TPA: hypothetical protein VEG61_06730 [Candidatus Dormibacteraeota bacterium]|nr:hypothetical protein [Candidatus Dormibacteraeota bacterium]
MSGILIFRLRRRRAVSTMIGGVIVLSLLLTALGIMVFVTQQFDQYQQTVNRMAQYRNQQLSEDLVATSPGLTLVTSSTIPGWGSGCGTTAGTGITYICYNATISNLGEVGVQITRIYINSTGAAGLGCSYPNPAPCILNPTSSITAYSFEEASEFLNPGEANHAVLFALPCTSVTQCVILPDPNPAFPQNSILIATSRGTVFSFQWPFQVSVFGQSQSAYSSGNMKVAYTGTYDSKNEPGPVAAGSGGTATTGYCHTESAASYPAAAGYAEELNMGTSGYGDKSGSNYYLWFVNPWITSTIMTSASCGSGCSSVGSTQVYIYVFLINTGTTSYTPTAGTIDLTWYGSNHIDGYLIGVYYNGAFDIPSSYPSIPPGASYYAVFKITIFTIGNNPWTVQSGSPSIMFWGGASITNGYGSNNENQGFFSGTLLPSGLWERYEASSGSCA